MTENQGDKKEPKGDKKPPADEVRKSYQGNARSDQRQDDASHPGWRKWHRNPEYVFAASIVLFTLFLTVSAIFQSCVMQRQRETMDETLKVTKAALKKDQRPIIWLMNAGHGIPNFVSEFGQVTWSWHIMNYGKSPALKIRIYEEIKIGDNPFTIAHGAKGPRIGAPLPPNKDDFSTVVSDPGITQEIYNRLLTVDGSIRIRARIEYTDTTGDPYETIICLSRLRSNAITYCEGNDIK